MRFGGSRGERAYKVSSVRSAHILAHIKVLWRERGRAGDGPSHPENIPERIQLALDGTDVVSQPAWRATTI